MCMCACVNEYVSCSMPSPWPRVLHLTQCDANHTCRCVELAFHNLYSIHSSGLHGHCYASAPRCAFMQVICLAKGMRAVQMCSACIIYTHLHHIYSFALQEARAQYRGTHLHHICSFASYMLICIIYTQFPCKRHARSTDVQRCTNASHTYNASLGMEWHARIMHVQRCTNTSHTNNKHACNLGTQCCTHTSHSSKIARKGTREQIKPLAWTVVLTSPT